MTLFFLDTEFIDDGRTIELISLALVSDEGKELHLLNQDCDLRRGDDFVQHYVIPYLPSRLENEDLWVCHRRMASKVEEFLYQHRRPYVFWAYYADYDWVAFCQLWGKMVDLPNDFPKYCRDLKQEMDRLGIDKNCVPQEGRQHDALEDARWNKKVWEYLRGKNWP